MATKGDKVVELVEEARDYTMLHDYRRSQTLLMEALVIVLTRIAAELTITNDLKHDELAGIMS